MQEEKIWYNRYRIGVVNVEKEKIDFGGGTLENKKKNRKVGVGILSILLVLVLLLGASFAWFTLTLNGTKQNVVKVGKLSLVLTEGDAITIDSIVPTYTNAALSETPYTFTVGNNGTVDADYQIYLDNKGTITNLSRFNYALKKDGKLLSINALSKLSNSMLFQGMIHPGESSSYELYIWLDANTTSKQVESLLTGTYESAIRIESNQPREKKLSSLVAHACDGVENCTKEVGDTTYFQNGYYGADSNRKYIWYSGKMWIATNYDSNGNVKAVTATEQTYMPWGPTLDYKGSYVESWINEQFLPSLNNYEKLLVTDYTWNYSSETGSNFADPIGTDKMLTSPVGLLNKEEIYYGSDQDEWINSVDVILGMLGQYYYTLTPTMANNIFVGGMGHLGYGDYSLNKTDFAGVLPAIVFKNSVTIVSGSGTKSDPYRLKGDEPGKQNELLSTRYSGEYVAFGEGINSSYRISEIEEGKVKLISTNALKEIAITTDGKERWQNLNEDYYEVSDTPSYPYVIEGGNYLHYDANSKDYPAAYFLNHEFLTTISGYISSSDKNMILTNQNFYTGTVTGSSSYKNAKDTTKAVIATVGLPILGETFNIPQKEDAVYPKNISVNGDSTLFMTNDGNVPYYQFQNSYFNGSASSDITSFRPSFYLKDTVKIKGGSGTKTDPYILSIN